MQTYTYKQMNNNKLFSQISTLFDSEIASIATIKAVFSKDSSNNWQFFIGKCEIGTSDQDECLIYAEHAFITRIIPDFGVKFILESIDNDGYMIHPDMPYLTRKKDTNMMWDEEIIPSNFAVSDYPTRKFKLHLGSNSHFTESGLIGFNMPFYSSSSSYLKKYLRMHQFHGASDARNGEFSIEMPDHRGRILIQNGKLSIDGEGENMCLVGKTPRENSILLSLNSEIDFDERDLSESELWLVTENNELLDYRTKNTWPYLPEDNEGKTRDIILKIIDQGETHTTEFKKYIDLTSKKADEFEKTVCAFSNAKGGHLLVGVADDGTIEGIDQRVSAHYKTTPNEAIMAYIQGIKKRLSEILRFNLCFEIAPIKLTNEHVIVIEVSRSEDTNYFTKTKLAYIRRGASSFKMASAEEREKDNKFNQY